MGTRKSQFKWKEMEETQLKSLAKWGFAMFEI